MPFDKINLRERGDSPCLQLLPGLVLLGSDIRPTLFQCLVSIWKQWRSQDFVVVGGRAFF